METLSLSLLLGIPLGTIILPEILRSQSASRWYWFCGLLAVLFVFALDELQTKYAGLELVARAFGSTVVVQGLCGFAFYRLFPRKRT